MLCQAYISEEKIYQRSRDSVQTFKKLKLLVVSMEMLKPTITKVVAFLILLVAEFFRTPIKGHRTLTSYATDGSITQSVDIPAYCTVYQQQLNNCAFSLMNYITIFVVIIITYIIVSFVVSKMKK